MVEIGRKNWRSATSGVLNFVLPHDTMLKKKIGSYKFENVWRYGGEVSSHKGKQSFKRNATFKTKTVSDYYSVYASSVLRPSGANI